MQMPRRAAASGAPHPLRLCAANGVQRAWSTQSWDIIGWAPLSECNSSMERQFDRPRPHDPEARVAAELRRSPKDVISPSREMTTDMVQPPAAAGAGIDMGSVAVA